MKTFSAIVASLAFVSTVAAVPSVTEKREPVPAEVLAPRASSTLTPITVKGNGKPSWCFMI